jgi:hypothetical protein
VGRTRRHSSLAAAPRATLLLVGLLAALTGGCAPESDPSEAPIDEPASEAPVDEEPTPYDGPAYRACVSDAQCRAGDACTTVPGYAGSFCAPACDPGGDGSECALEDLPFGTRCLESGRCARGCHSSELPGSVNPDGDEDYRLCPSTVGCQNVDGERLCAGETFGQAGYYGTCTHPLMDGTDCPPASTCVGGAVIGTGDVGICLPWCDDGSCPPPPGQAFNTTTICYDILLDHPMCGLLCDTTSDLTTCPDSGQECQEFYGYGLCAPPGAQVPF